MSSVIYETSDDFDCFW